jgi:hypothetical protein
MQIPSRSNASALANTPQSRPLSKGAQSLPPKPAMVSSVPSDAKPSRGQGADLAARVEAWASEVMGRLEGLEGSLSEQGMQQMKGVHGDFQANVESLLEGIRSGAVDGAGASQSVGTLLGDLKTGMAGMRAEMQVDDTGMTPVDGPQAAKGAMPMDGMMRAEEMRETNTTHGSAMGTAIAQGSVDAAGSTDMTPAERVAMLREQILERLGNASGIDIESLREVGDQLNTEFGRVLDGLAAGTMDISDVGQGVLSSIRNLVSGLQAPDSPDGNAMTGMQAIDGVEVMSSAEATEIQERLADWADQTEHRLTLLASSAGAQSAGSVEATQEAYMESLRDLSSAVANGSLSGADVATQMTQIMESLRGNLQELFPNADSGRLYGRNALGADAPGSDGKVDFSV